MKPFIDTENFDDFFNALKEMRGISSINKYILNLLFEIEPKISLNIQKFLTLCFSLFDDGNTRVPLTENQFYEMWSKKWRGLVQLNISTSESELTTADFSSENDFKSIISEGVSLLPKLVYNNIIEGRFTYSPIEEYEYSKPFLLAYDNNKIPYLYFAKHFNAKCYIENAAKQLFTNGNLPTDKEISKCIEEISKIRKPTEKGPFLINKQQAIAILRGLNQNLIITGGPGTGKTTVVLYILWNLLESNKHMQNWNIYLAAPSGKAADRMRESLSEGLSQIEDNVKSSKNGRLIYNKLKDLESCTLHRLLKYSFKNGDFYYNKKEPFPKNSIFVIDEASMIDIEMFASFLQAIPQDSRLFILGDPYQLPSVESGAVLGEILKAKNSQKNFTVKLEISNRFTDKSNIGKLAKEIKEVAESGDELIFKEHPFLLHPYFATNIDSSITETHIQEGIDQVSFYHLNPSKNEKTTKKIDDKRIEKIVNNWVKDFEPLLNLAQQIHPIESNNETEIRDKIWNLSLTKRILSAERKGPRGVENLNKKACNSFRNFFKKNDNNLISIIKETGYFPGQLLIITQNQEMYKLYNGDTGIVVFDEYTPYLMLKKSSSKDNIIKRDDYVFYPLSILPEDSYETAFAITIHKSQGSEYEHVTLFLPKQKGHPLLTNQIIYTGITRAKKSVTLIATEETYKAACCTITQRETGIKL